MQSFGTNKGHQMSIEGHLEGAVDYYAEGLRIDPTHFDLQFNLG